MAVQNYFNFEVKVVKDTNDSSKNTINVQTGPHGLASGGLMMDIVVGVDIITADAMKKQGLEIPPPIVVKALFDTGCSKTCIDNSLATDLKLKVISYSKSLTANGAANITNHIVALGFPGTSLKGRHVFAVCTANLAGQSIKALIGRDLMANWAITYNGLTGFISIAD